MKNKTSRRTFLTKLAAGVGTFTITSAKSEQILNHIEIPEMSSEHFIANAKKFVPVMITPFTVNQKIDYEVLSRLIDFYMSSGVKGLFANCLSSEMYHLDDEERLALTSHVVKHIKGTVPVVATGSFGKSIEQQADFAGRMYDTGVNAVILITSHFAKKEDSDEILIRNLEKFFSLTGNIPMGTYECPSPYKRIITPDVLKFLLSTKRVTYHKDTTLDLDKIKVKLEMCKNTDLEFYDAHTPNAMYSLQMGAKGLSCIAGNFYPEIFVWMCDHVNDPQYQQQIKWLQSELTRADSIISQGYPLSAKYFLSKRGVPVELVSRTNNTSLSQEQKQTLDKVHTSLMGWHERLNIKVVH